LAAFGLAAFFAFAGSLAAFTSPILKDPDAPVPHQRRRQRKRQKKSKLATGVICAEAVFGHQKPF
jgi:hypothetical protein